MRRFRLRQGALVTAGLLVLACAKGRDGRDDLSLEADIQVLDSMPAQLQGRLTVENPTEVPVSFDVGGCPAFLRVYRPTGGEHVWDQSAAAICIMTVRTVTLEPGAAETFETPAAIVTDILGETLTPGAYRAGVYLALAGEGGHAEADAGEVELAR